MSTSRPKLNVGLEVDDFCSFYWLKQELMAFCRAHGISTMGSKKDLEERIKVFLVTKDTQKASLVSPVSAKSAPQAVVFELDAKVPPGFQCSYEAREFFIAHLGPTFRYSVALQKWVKAHPGITFLQLIDEYKRQLKAKNTSSKGHIDAQFEYNQFTRDYFNDPANKGKSRQDCIAAWQHIKAQRGPRTYRPA